MPSFGARLPSNAGPAVPPAKWNLLQLELPAQGFHGKSRRLEPVGDQLGDCSVEILHSLIVSMFMQRANLS